MAKKAIVCNLSFLKYIELSSQSIWPKIFTFHVDVVFYVVAECVKSFYSSMLLIFCILKFL